MLAGTVKLNSLGLLLVNCIKLKLEIGSVSSTVLKQMWVINASISRTASSLELQKQSWTIEVLLVRWWLESELTVCLIGATYGGNTKWPFCLLKCLCRADRESAEVQMFSLGFKWRINILAPQGFSMKTCPCLALSGVTMRGFSINCVLLRNTKTRLFDSITHLTVQFVCPILRAM